jgi:hypothetical protein
MSKQKPHGEAPLPPGWCNTKGAAKYAGVQPRTVRSWHKKGLKHVVIGPKTRLSKFEHIDEFLNGFNPNDGAAIKDMATEIYNNFVSQK